MSKKHIFLIDDDFINHVITKNTLELYVSDLEISQFTSAKKALQAIQEGVIPEVILLDVFMPIMNGWDFLNELENLNIAINTFILTFSMNDKDLQQSRRFAFIKGFFNKPINQKNINFMLQFLENSSDDSKTEKSKQNIK